MDWHLTTRMDGYIKMGNGQGLKGNSLECIQIGMTTGKDIWNKFKVNVAHRWGNG